MFQFWKRSSNESVRFRFFYQFSGILTFPKSTELRKIASEIPIDRVLIETDSPFLAPAPFRGKVNEPAYTVYTLQTLSDTISKPINEIAKQTYENTLKLFSKIGEYE